jgi:cysteine desulfurase family protein
VFPFDFEIITALIDWLSMQMIQKEKVIYLNNAASAWPRAPGVAEAVTESINTPPLHPGRTVSRSMHVINDCRSGLAKLFNIEDSKNIILTTNATYALNIAILGAGLKEGDIVVTSGAEHNSVLRPLAHLERRAGIETIIVPLDDTGKINEDEYGEALSRKPHLVVLNHLSNVTGTVQNIEKLFRKAREIDAITLLDASQSVGHISVHVDELYTDMIAFTGHKGLRGPAGTGGLFVAPRIELDQVFVGGTGVRSDLRYHPSEMPTRLEAGTPNIPALAGLAAALDWYNDHGESSRCVESQFADAILGAFKDISRVRVFNNIENTERAGIISFVIDGWDVEEAGFILNESFNIICRTGLHCAPLIHKYISNSPEGTIRFSVSSFNTPSEIDKSIKAVRKLAK